MSPPHLRTFPNLLLLPIPLSFVIRTSHSLSFMFYVLHIYSTTPIFPFLALLPPSLNSPPFFPPLLSSPASAPPPPIIPLSLGIHLLETDHPYVPNSRSCTRRNPRSIYITSFPPHERIPNIKISTADRSITTSLASPLSSPISHPFYLPTPPFPSFFNRPLPLPLH